MARRRKNSTLKQITNPLVDLAGIASRAFKTAGQQIGHTLGSGIDVADRFFCAVRLPRIEQQIENLNERIANKKIQLSSPEARAKRRKRWRSSLHRSLKIFRGQLGLFPTESDRIKNDIKNLKLARHDARYKKREVGKRLNL